MLTLSHLDLAKVLDRGLGIMDSHQDGLFMQGPNEGQWGRGIKILGEMAEWANNSLNKQTQSINNESVTWLEVFAFALAYWKGRVWATVCFHYCPCRFYHWSLDTASVFYFKCIKTAPDTSIPTRGIEKHLACRLPGLPPRMSASDEGEKNDALYGHCKKPFMQPQLSHRECVALTHGG